MSCSNSFRAEQVSMLNLGPQETDLGSGELKVRHGGCLATGQMPGGKAGGLWRGLDLAAALLEQNRTEQNTTKQNNLNLIQVEYVLNSRKARFSGVGNPMECLALMVAPGNTHFNSD